MHGLAGLGRAQDVAERDEVALLVGHLDPDRRPTRDRRQDAHVGRGHRVRDVLVEACHAGDLHAGGELELVARDGGADGHPHEARLDTVGGERGFEDAARLFHEPFVDLLSRAAGEQAQRGQLPTALLRRRAEWDLELLDDGLVRVLVFGVVVFGVVVDVDVELGRLVLVDRLVAGHCIGRGGLLLEVVDHRHRVRRLAHVDHGVPGDAAAGAVSRQRRHRPDDAARCRMHWSHSVGRTRRDGTQGRPSEDEETRDPEPDEHQRRARGREHPLERQRDDRSQVATGVAELVDWSTPPIGPERELQQAGRRDRDQREPETEPQPLDGCTATDERDADARERDRHGEPRPADEQADAVAERLADHAGPVRVDPERGEDGDDDAGEAGQIALVALDRLAPSRPARRAARGGRLLGLGLRLLSGDHSNHNRNSSNMSNTGCSKVGVARWADGERRSQHEVEAGGIERARP